MSSGADETSATPETKQELTPKLRFPEFRNAPEWQESRLKCFLNESRVLGKKGDVAKKITVKLWGKGVHEKKDELQGSVNTQYYRRAAGQFIYSKLDFLNQAFGIIPEHLNNFESTVDLPCFDIKEGINPVFLLEYVKRKDFYERLGETADGSRKARRIHPDTFLSFSIFLPTIEEQKKIANCLSSLDELISAQRQKLEHLQAHKKGLMRQLFPAEGETVPKLRFPEFRGGLEWKKRLLEEFFIHIRNGFVGTATPYYVTNGIPYLQGKNIKQGKIDPSGLVSISAEFHQRQRKSQLRINDVLVVQSGHVGECALVDKNFAGGNCHALIVMSPNESTCSPFFIHYLYSQLGESAINHIKTGNTIEHILASDLTTGTKVADNG